MANINNNQRASQLFYSNDDVKKQQRSIYEVNDPVHELKSLEKTIQEMQAEADKLRKATGQAPISSPVLKVQHTSLDPTAMGCTGFSLATVLLGFYKCGFWEAGSSSSLAIWGFFVGGLMQVVAGVFEMQNGGGFGAWAFSLFGWNWMATGLQILLEEARTIPGAGGDGEDMKALWMFFFTFCLFVLSWKISYYHIVMMALVNLIFLFEVISFIVGGSSGLDFAGGVCCVASGYMALFLAFTENFNDMWNGEKIKIGKFD